MKSAILFLFLFGGSWALSRSPHAGLAVIPAAILFHVWQKGARKTHVFGILFHLIVLFCIVLFSTLLWAWGRDKYEIFRDVYYFGKPILFIYAGMLLYHLLDNDYCKCLKLFAFTITFQIILQIIYTQAAGITLQMSNRLEAGFLAIESNVLFLITALARRQKLPIFSAKTLLCMELIALMGIFFSFGRTFYIFAVVAWLLILCDQRTLYKWTAIVMTIFALVTIFGGVMLSERLNAATDEDYESMNTKLKNSFNELLVTERTDAASINLYWRGFEAYLGLQMFKEGNFMQKSAGQGAGAICRNDIFQDGDASDLLSDIPIFHIGYITILLKAGYLGLLFFFLFIFNLFKKSRFKGQPGYFVTSILALLGINLLFNTQVIHGIFTNGTPMFLLLLLGASLACRRYIQTTDSPEPPGLEAVVDDQFKDITI